MTKAKIITALVKGGNNTEGATKLVEANFDYVMRVYADQGLTAKGFANIIMSLGY